MHEMYERLRGLVSPVVAVTTHRGAEANGLVVNSALRASLSPEKLRISIIVHKFNYSHDMILESGVFTVHLLHPDQIDLVVRLGCASARDGAKLIGLGHRPGTTGAPVLDRCHTFYECRVINAMDTGGSTIFLGAVDNAGGPGGPELMSTAHVRAGLPTEYRPRYEADLERGQRFATRMADRMRPLVWRDLVVERLSGAAVPATSLPTTDGSILDLAGPAGSIGSTGSTGPAGSTRTVLYVYPMTGRPGEPPPDGWDLIPGARGCTPEACGFRDHHDGLAAAGAVVFGLSSQDTAYQREVVDRLGLPFPLVSDTDLVLARGLGLPTFDVNGDRFYRRITLILRAGRVERVFYPVDEPGEHAAEVLGWLHTHTPARSLSEERHPARPDPDHFDQPT